MSALVHELVTAQVERTPDAPAVIRGAEMATYAALERRSNQVARMLRDSGARRGDCVCVIAPPTATTIAAVLGVMKSDAIYVPLNPADSPDRLAAIVTRCQPACVLMAAPTATIVDEWMRIGAIGRDTVIGSLEQSPIVGHAFVAAFSVADIAQRSDRAVASRNRATNPASVVFPSQADQPRGVVATHASLARMAGWASEQFDVRRGDRHAATAAPGSDRALFETVVALASGAGLLVSAPDLAHPRRAAEFLRRERLTQWLTTADTLSRMAEADVVLPGDFPALRRVLWFAEALSPNALRYWMRRVGHARFTSLFGAPETATVSACHTWGQEPLAGEPAMPVGAPCQGQQVLVLNAGLEPVDAGEVGDVWVRGAGLSPGYWRDTAATAQAFHHAPSSMGGERMWRTGQSGRRSADGQLHVVVRDDAAGPNPAMVARPVTLESGASA